MHSYNINGAPRSFLKKSKVPLGVFLPSSSFKIMLKEKKKNKTLYCYDFEF